MALDGDIKLSAPLPLARELTSSESSSLPKPSRRLHPLTRRPVRFTAQVPTSASAPMELDDPSDSKEQKRPSKSASNSPKESHELSLSQTSTFGIKAFASPQASDKAPGFVLELTPRQTHWTSSVARMTSLLSVSSSLPTGESKTTDSTSSLPSKSSTSPIKATPQSSSSATSAAPAKMSLQSGLATPSAQPPSTIS